jgi:hypothetical protein
LVLVLVSACSSSAASSNPCSQLRRSEIADGIGAEVEVGRRVQAIGEKEQRMCSYRVSTSLDTVTVYLGHGIPPGGIGANVGGATAARGSAYVSISARKPDRSFPALALRLAQRAIEHTSET